MTEWRRILGWPDYEVSSSGDVRRHANCRRQNGELLLRPYVTHKGHNMFTLFDANGERHRIAAHRLIALAFHGEPPDRSHVAAIIDGDPEHLSAANIAWMTVAEVAAAREARRPRKSASVIGQRFGRLMVLREAKPKIRPSTDRPAHRDRRAVCRCDCGAEGEFAVAHLRRGGSQSCGCLQRERVAQRMTTHGETLGRIRSTEYRTWKAMRQRCGDPFHQDFRLYGGRGIKVCDRWQSFSNFLADMGRKPSASHSIDRIDNDRGYEPGNCRWATAKEQRANQRPRSGKTWEAPR